MTPVPNPPPDDSGQRRADEGHPGDVRPQPDLDDGEHLCARPAEPSLGRRRRDGRDLRRRQRLVDRLPPKDRAGARSFSFGN